MFSGQDYEGPTTEQLWRAAERMGVHNPLVYCDLAQGGKVCVNFDVSRGGSSLSRLYHAGKISPAMYRAGTLYSYYRYVVYNRAWPRISTLNDWVASETIWDLSPPPKRDATDEDREERYRSVCEAYDTADEALQRIANPNVRRMVRVVAIDGLDPKPMWNDRTGEMDERELEWLIRGLVKLATVWRIVT